MKKILSLLLVLGMGLCLFGCQKNEKPKEEQKQETISIVGDWKISDITISEKTLLEAYGVQSVEELTEDQKKEFDENKTLTEAFLKGMLETMDIKMTFKEDGTCSVSEGYATDETYEENSCKYTLEDKTITLTYESEDDEPITTPITYNEGKLLLEEEDSGMILTFSPVAAE